MDEVFTIAELDRRLALLDKAAEQSDDTLRAQFGSFFMKFPLELPQDPYSQAYHEVQMKAYEWITGGSYTVMNESMDFDIELHTKWPFPYITKSNETVGNQLIAMGFIIKKLGLQPGASILEFGPGWGNTSLFLARMGYQVTIIDIEANYVSLIEKRATNKGLTIEGIQGDFFDAGQLGRTFDGILFFECFHHCADHISFIKLFDQLLNPGGRVLFAAEPISEEFPIPWGLRLDAESLRAIRKFGWLELGFQESYFTRTMMRHGWVINKYVCNESPWGIIFDAQKVDGRYRLGQITLPPDEEATWVKQGHAENYRFTTNESKISIHSADQYREVYIRLANYSPDPMQVRFQIGTNHKQIAIDSGVEKMVRIPYSPADPMLILRTNTWSPKLKGLSEDDRLLGIAVFEITLVE